MKLKKIILIVLIFVFSIQISSYFKNNKLYAEIRSCSVSKDISYHFPLYEFSINAKTKAYFNQRDCYFVTVYLNIENKKETTYNRWRCFVKNTDKNFKVWIDKSVPEGYGLHIKENSILEGYTSNLIVYKENSSCEEIETFVRNNLEIYVVGLPVK